MINQLLLSKYIYKKGEGFLDTNNPMSCGLAISLFHDAVELLLWTIAKEFDANIKERDSFIGLYDAITAAKKNKKHEEPPLKAKMVELNKARVNFKHFGNMPAPTDAIKFFGYTDDFLRESTKSFFNLDYSAISLTDLIHDERIKSRLKESEELLLKGNLEDSIRKCVEAEHYLDDLFDRIFPEVDKNIAEGAYIFERDKIHNARSLLKYIEQYLNALRGACMISLLGIKLPDYIRYNNISPVATRPKGDKFYFHLKPRTLTKDDVYFCINYVTNAALLAQDKFKSTSHLTTG